MREAAGPPAGHSRPLAGIRLSGLGLHLREWTDEDLPAMVGLFDDPAVARWTPLRSPFDLAAARAYLEQSRHRRIEHRRIQLAVTTDGSTALGEILLAPTGPAGPDPDGRTAELAYAIGAAHRGRGLATRAVRLMTGYAYHQLAMEHVVLRVAPDNVASIAVARGAGFESAGGFALAPHDGHPLSTWLHRGTRGGYDG